MSIIKKSIVGCVVAATLASGVIAATGPAEAGYRGGWGGPLAAGVIGGLAMGAIIGGATRPAYGYGYAPAYGYEPVPAYSPCYRSRTPVYDAYGDFAGYRSIRVCN
jgi:hypothetical protein